MTRYVLGRLAAAVAVLIALSLLSFLMVRLIPGDPVANVINTATASAEQIAEVRARLGLDRPWLEQYFTWLGGLLTGQMGMSLTQPIPISEQVAARLPVTLELALLGTLFSILIGFPLGVAAAIHRGRWPDIAIRTGSFILIAAPVFVIAALIVLVNSTTLKLPLLTYTSWATDPVGHLGTLLVPGLLLGVPMGAVLARYIRNALLDTLDQDFIRTARAKGASPRRLALKHGLRNAMIPVITVLGAQLAVLVGGTIVIENVFVLPGMGTALISAINTTDYPTIQTLIVILGALYVLINLVVDLSYPLFDPRVRLVSR